MTPTLQNLKDAAATLPAEDRAELAHFLLESLEPVEEGWADAWREELSRRMEEIRTGKAMGIPAEDVLARLRERYP